ncbi:50S ribosomal protein L24 [Buchnera aphidicola]|uniref:50S ribosomal protein L24 n=1 Tax=Buchnera aphidicola TaxID=9 RepID=UPI0034638E79
MAFKIHCNDKVIVICGRDKGKIGVVKKIIKKDKAIVSGINIVKKHQKPIPSQNINGGIIKKESPIHISNIAFLNPVTNKADRIGFKFEQGKKVRFLKSNKHII